MALPLEIVKEVVEEIREHTKGDFAESRYFKQLRIFVQLRSSIQLQFEKVMQAVSQFFREEKDFLFQRGEAIGEARGIEKERAIAETKLREERARAEAKMHEEKRAIAGVMKADGLPTEKISKFTGLSTDEIEGL